MWVCASVNAMRFAICVRGPGAINVLGCNRGKNNIGLVITRLLLVHVSSYNDITSRVEPYEWRELCITRWITSKRFSRISLYIFVVWKSGWMWIANLMCGFVMDDANFRLLWLHVRSWILTFTITDTMLNAPWNASAILCAQIHIGLLLVFT